MRHIRKKLHHSNSLDKLSRAHRERQPVNAAEAGRLWGKLDKSGILNLLLSEQYYLCCYSEIRADELGLGYHIEHIENKSQNPARTFDYTNLLASAFESNKLGLSSDVFGGHAVGKIGNNQPVDMTLLVSPLQADCADFFTYTSDGKINPNPGLSQHDIERAEYTIDILNLNSAELVTRREQLWQELDKLFQEHQQPNSDITVWLEIELLPRNDKLESFFSLKRQFFADLGQSVLATYENGILL